MSLSLGWLGSTAGADGRPAAGDVRSRRAPGGPLGGPCGPSVRPGGRTLEPRATFDWLATVEPRAALF